MSDLKMPKMATGTVLPHIIHKMDLEASDKLRKEKIEKRRWLIGLTISNLISIAALIVAIIALLK